MTCNIIEVGGVINNSFTRNKFCLKSELNKKIEQFTGDKYMTIYSYDSEDISTCNFIAPLYLDFDIDDLENNYSKLIRDLKIVIYRLKTELYLEERDIEIYFSGAKGFHIIIDHRILGFEPSRTLNKDLKAVALYFKASTFTKCIDTSIYDYRRLFRVPNTINTKTGLYKVPIMFNDLINMSYKELLKYASKPHTFIKKPKVYNKKVHDAFYELVNKLSERERRSVNTSIAREYVSSKKLLPCVEYLLQNGAEEGQRNNCTIALASALFQIGHSKEEVTEILEVWNKTKNDIPISDKELYTTINSAYNNSRNNMYYGCSAFRDLGLCVKGCPIKNKGEMIVREDIKKLLSAGKNKEEVKTVDELDNKTQIQDYYNNLANDIDKFDDLAWKSKTGYDTPHFPSFTKNLEGWSPGFYTFAGAANHGKTAMLLNILEDLCMTEENKLFGIFFSLDDSKNKVIPRVVAMRETIPISAVAKPARYKQMIDNGHEDTLLFNEYLVKRKEGLESLKSNSNKMVIFDSTEIKTFTQLYDTIKNVYMYVKSQDEEANIVVAIDSLKDINLDDIRLDTSERIAEVARRIKDISIEFNCIVLSSMHLRKLNATRRPTLDDLREANTLEYELDACFLVYNDVSRNKQSAKIFRYDDEQDTEKKPVLEVDWAKNKISSYKGVTFCNFSPEYNKCTEVSEVASSQYLLKLYSL